ncbi:MAG: LLM class flavin-dependent oxidoreductase [Pseudobdellovibrionaceae bacterium]
MKFDIFLSICQTEVDGYLPSEKVMFENFFHQLKLADELGFETAWVAETHLSCQIQKQNPHHVIPHFKGEIGLNTDILQMSLLGMAQTRKIGFGSAIRNIICNGGPLAHAEAVRTFLTLQQFSSFANRKFHLGFAAGRFPFTNEAYGFVPKTELERTAWDVIKNKYFAQATEILLRALRGDHFSSQDLKTQNLTRKDFRSEEAWMKVQRLSQDQELIPLDCHWQFGKVGVIPFEAPLKNLKLTIGSHDPEIQIFANQFLPTGVFNLSITPPAVIEETHLRLQKAYHQAGGPWKREYMPRTVMLFIDDTPGLSPAAQSEKAKLTAEKAWRNYWTAMENTLDPQKVAQAVGNTIAGNPIEVLEQIRGKYHPEDRLMLWFDFNNHDNESISRSMKAFMEKIAPQL